MAIQQTEQLHVQEFEAHQSQTVQPTADYAVLKKMIKERGLLDKQPTYLMKKMIFTAVMLICSVSLLFITNSMWIQIPNAIFMAFIFGQIGFICHDAGHRQGFKTTTQNDFFGILHGNLILGMSYRWWVDKHNEHHAHPNELDCDPDIDIPILAFSREDALKKQGAARFIVKHQRYFFFPLLLLEALSLHFESLQFVFTKGPFKYRTAEMVLIVAHFVWYFSLIILTLGGWQAAVFIVIQQALFGLYMGSVFAPNHKGMLIIGEGNTMSFLEKQVLTARNVNASPLIDFWYGGLNYQIEHHLFPSMARNQLEEAQKIIRSYCQQHGISYYETGLWQSYGEILDYMHEISAPLRATA